MSFTIFTLSPLLSRSVVPSEEAGSGLCLCWPSSDREENEPKEQSCF